MSTPDTSLRAPGGLAERPLRLRLARDLGRNHLDGGWWPYSRDLTAEVGDLVDHFPSDRGRVVRALFSPPDWEIAPRRVPTARGYVKTGSFVRDDTHLVLLTLADRTVLHVLVVPPGFTREQGEEALLAAATAGNEHSAAELLATVVDQPPATDAADHWSDDGGSWSGPHAGAPSSGTPV